MLSHENVIDVITVDKSVETAKEIIAKLSERLDRRYEIYHAANCKSIESMIYTLQSLITPPKLLTCSGRYFEEEAESIRTAAQKIYPKLALIYIPADLTNIKMVVDYMKDEICGSKLPERDTRAPAKEVPEMPNFDFGTPSQAKGRAIGKGGNWL